MKSTDAVQKENAVQGEINLARISDALKLEKNILATVLGTSAKNLERWIARPELAEESYRYQLLRDLFIKSQGVIRLEKLGSWLVRPQADLGNYKPVTLMADIQGFKDILKLLESYRGGAYA